MNIVSFGAIFINIIMIIIFVVALINVHNTKINPQSKANLGVFMGITTILYLIALTIVLLICLLKSDYIALLLLLPIISPFIIGYYSTYTKIQKYTVLQIISCIFSLVILSVLQIF